MAISRIKVWSAGEVLLASDLNSEFNNILNNPVDLWSPAGKSLNLGGFALFYDAAGTISLVSVTNGISIVGGAFNEAHGADITSAATINLDTATGNVVDVTGAVAITAITLSDGRERVVRFTGSLILTHGASLVLPGAKSMITAAGDYAIFRGYAAGVVRLVGYSPAAAIGPRVLDAQFTNVGNVGVGTDTLMTFPLPANTLLADGKAIRTSGSGTVANNANAKTLIANFGTHTAPLTLTASIVSSWRAEIVAIRSASNTQKVRFYLTQTANSGTAVTTVFSMQGSATDTAAIVVKMTAIGVNDDDVVQLEMITEALN